MNIVITGADGFFGRHLSLRIKETRLGSISGITKKTNSAARLSALATADVVVHLAGVNRPPDEAHFEEGNTNLTKNLCADLVNFGRRTPVIFTSSTQSLLDNPYGRSKRLAEDALMAYAVESGAPVAYFRFANVFGKWARPNYNSAVATFCYNIARDLPIHIDDANAKLRLIYVDDAVSALLELIRDGIKQNGEHHAGPVYETTVGKVAQVLKGFATARDTNEFGSVGAGLLRKLYATYVSYLPAERFSYPLLRHEDSRGAFAEILRTPDAGQISFFTAHPGITRGGHYHHSKTEKFLVVQGQARFRFRNVVTGELITLDVEASESRVVDTVPGWAHDITNTGDVQLVVVLWANEVFDPSSPDTIPTEIWG